MAEHTIGDIVLFKGKRAKVISLPPGKSRHYVVLTQGKGYLVKPEELTPLPASQRVEFDYE